MNRTIVTSVVQVEKQFTTAIASFHLRLYFTRVGIVGLFLLFRDHDHEQTN